MFLITDIVQIFTFLFVLLTVFSFPFEIKHTQSHEMSCDKHGTYPGYLFIQSKHATCPGYLFIKSKHGTCPGYLSIPSSN